MKIPSISITLIMDIIKLFTSWQIEEIAKEVGFTTRKRGVSPVTFLKAFTLGVWSLHEVTLETLSSKCCSIQHGLKLTRQALFYRLKAGSDLLRRLLIWSVAYTAKHSISTETMNVLKQFKNVYICDGTMLSLPDKLADKFEGLGGTNSDAAVKIQLIFSLIEKKFRKIELFSGRSNDSKYTHEIAKILSYMDLIMFDLGYLNLVAFKEIMDKGAYFLSRVKCNTKFFVDYAKKEGWHTEVALTDILKQSNGKVDREIYVGVKPKTRIKVRLVAIKLPEEVVNERRRRENKRAKRSGKTLTDYEKEMLAWNIYITNIQADMLSPETVCEIYRLRWQVELIFKAWKSYFSIGKMGNVGEKYFECLLYGRLIVITLMITLYSVIFYIMFKKHRRLVSMLRFFKNLREKFELLL